MSGQISHIYISFFKERFRSNPMRELKPIIAGLALASVASVDFAIAQESSGDGPVLEEVMVTATRRGEADILSTPVSAMTC
jgi:hypothetical protein